METLCLYRYCFFLSLTPHCFLQVFHEYAALSEGNPLHDYVGKLLDGDALESVERTGDVSLATTTAGLELQDKSPANVADDLGARSLASLQQMAGLHVKLNLKDYQEHIVDYITEWEQVITTKADRGLKDVKKLHSTRTHYESKVEGLRRRVNQLETKEKEVPPALVEKLARNETKLDVAWKAHEQQASLLCVLLKEITEQGWRDAYPLLRNAMKWEVNRLGRENITYGKLPGTLDAMKAAMKVHS